MRYAALVEYSDAMDFGSHRMLTHAQRRMRVRWPDEVLYALAQYIYSLQPPSNPNRRDDLADGEKLFATTCAGCHTPPLYTNNRLTLAQGFVLPDNHPLRVDILPISVGTDASLALKTRKGTGLYKCRPSKGSGTEVCTATTVRLPVWRIGSILSAYALTTYQRASKVLE